MAVPSILLIASAFTLFSWIKSRLGIKRGWWAFVCVWLAFSTFILIGILVACLGNGFAAYPSLVQWYEYTGVMGGSLWILIANVLAYRIFYSRKFMVIVLWVFLPIVISFLIKPTLSETENVNVVVVQPNIDPHGEKFGGVTADEQLEKLLA